MIRINLAPIEARRRRPSMSLSMPSFNLGILFGIIYVLAIAGIGFYWYGLLSQESALTADIDRLNSELASLKTTIGANAGVKTQVDDVKRRVTILEEITKGQGRSIVLLDSFIDTVPRDLWITSLEQKDSVMKLGGTAFSTTAVSNFMANLKSSGKFKDVDIGISRQAIDKTPSLVTFEVTCKFEI
jgi:Tfp pilus assembly protein PilN